MGHSQKPVAVIDQNEALGVQNKRPKGFLHVKNLTQKLAGKCKT